MSPKGYENNRSSQSRGTQNVHSASVGTPGARDDGSEYQASPSRDYASSTLAELQAFAHTLAIGSTCADDQEWLQFQSESLVSWADKHSRLIISDEITRLLGGRAPLKPGGLEHQVTFIPALGRVVKTTKPPNFGARYDLSAYLDNLIWTNLVFADDIRFEGVVDTPLGASMIISQPFIDGRKPKEEEIDAWFLAQGCTRRGKHKWRFPDGTEIEDAHDGNLIVMRGGIVIPIDLQITKLGSNYLGQLIEPPIPVENEAAILLTTDGPAV